MIRALFVGLITVIALAAALLASEDRSAPPLAAEIARADLVLIDKSDRSLMLYQQEEMIFQTTIALGSNPVGDKQAEGDGRTPEGEYRIDRRNDQSKYYLSLGLNYPTKSQRVTAASQGRDPGGDIFIHGQPNLTPGALTLPGDWTNGCIAISNAAMRTIWRRVAMGTKVVVRP